MKRISVIWFTVIFLVTSMSGMNVYASRDTESLQSGSAMIAFGEPLTAAEAAQLLLDAASEQEVAIYVSPQGDDEAGSGLTNAPLRSPARARQVVAEVRKTAGKPIHVYFRDGKYFVNQSVVFGPDDSGTTTTPITYQACPGEHPVISGAKELSPVGWKVYSGKVMVADLEPGLGIDELFVNETKQIMGRYPNYNILQPLQGSTSQANIKTRSEAWADPVGGYIRAIHSNGWGGNSYIITGKNTGATIGLNYTWVGDNNRGAGMEGGSNSVMVENILEEVDTAHEWYYDNATGKLYYYPDNDTDLNTAKFEGAVTSELFKFVGEKEGRAVSGITLDGLTFFGTKRTLFTGNYIPLMRGDWCVARAGSVFLQDAEEIRIVNSDFRYIGGNAIFISGHNINHVIDNNEILHVGSTGILIAGLPESVREPSFWNVNVRDGRPMPEVSPYYVHKTTIDDAAPGPKSENYPRDITISKNHIMDVGVYEKQSCGVSMSVSARIKVLQNTIHDSPRSGINVNDGTFGGHEIAQNDVFDCQKETADHGQFNSWGRDRFWSLGGYDTGGNNGVQKYPVSQLDAMETVRIHDNRFYHDGKTSTWGIDLDDGSTNYEIYNNLCLNLGIKLREGFNRKVYNNIVVDGQINLHCTMADSHDQIFRNIVTTASPYNLAATNESRFAVSQNIIDRNWFYDGGTAQSYPGSWWDGTLNFDKNSVNADPGFLNIASNNYSVTNSSAMTATGFQNFPMSQFGKPGCLWQSPIYVKGGGQNPGTDRIMRENWLGAVITGIHNDAILTATGTTNYSGVYFEKVAKGSLAERCGFKENDIIKIVNGTDLGYKDTFAGIYDAIPAGALVTMGIVRDQIPRVINYIKTDTTQWVNDDNGKIFYSKGAGNGWVYTGKVENTKACYAGDLHYNQNGAVGDTWFEYQFTGTEISWFTRTEDNMGDAKVTVTDAKGKVVDTAVVDCTSAVQTPKALVYQSPTLEYGTYTLRAVKESGTYFLLDALRVVSNDDNIPLIVSGPVTLTKQGSDIEELQGGESVLVTLPVGNYGDTAFSGRVVVALYDAETIRTLETFREESVFIAPGKKKDYTYTVGIPADGGNKRLAVFLYDAQGGKPVMAPAVVNGINAHTGTPSFVSESTSIDFFYEAEIRQATAGVRGLGRNDQAILWVIADGKVVAVDQRTTDNQGAVAFQFGVDSKLKSEMMIKIMDSSGNIRTRFVVLDANQSLVDKSTLRALLTEAAKKVEGQYSFTSWKRFELAYRKALITVDEEHASQSDVNSVTKELREGMDGLALAVQAYTINGADSRFRIFRAGGTPDGGNRDGTSGANRDQWQRRPGTDPPQIDATVNGAYAVIEGDFLSFELLGADKSDSVNNFKIDIICDSNICSSAETQNLSNNRSGTVSLYTKTGLCGGHHTITFTDNDTRSGRYFEIRQFKYSAYGDLVPAIDEILIAAPPEKTSYFTGQSLDLTGAKITLRYAGGETLVLPVSADMVSGYDSQVPGQQTVIVTYGGKTTSFPVTVNPRAVLEIQLSSAPYKQTYLQGQELLLTGARLEVLYDDETRETVDVTAQLISGYQPEITGNQRVTVTYGKKTTTFDVIVTAKSLESVQIVSLPNKIEYQRGEVFDSTGGKLRLYWNNGGVEIIDITADMVSGFDSGFTGNQRLVVSYEGKTTNFTVKVAVPDAQLLQEMMANVEQLRKGRESYTAASWRIVEAAFLQGKQVLGNENRSREDILTATQNLSTAINGLTLASGAGTEDGFFYGNSASVTIYKSTGLPDGGNRDGTSGVDRDQWQRRSNTNPPQVDATIPGAYAVIDGDFTKLRLYGANKASSVRQFKVEVNCDKGICGGVTTHTLDRNVGETVLIYENNGLCGGHHTIRFIHDGDSGTYLELKRFEYTVQKYGEAHPTVSAISMERLPNQTTFPNGGRPDVLGATIRVLYQGGATAIYPVTQDMISGYEGTEQGPRSVTVTYEDCSTTFIATARPPAVLRISVSPPDRAEYFIGQELELAGGKVVTHYENGTKEEEVLTEDMLSGFDKTKKGIQTVIVTVDGRSATFAVEVRVEEERRQLLRLVYDETKAFHEKNLAEADKYTVNSWAALTGALTAGKAILDAAAPSRAEMDAAMDALEDAVSGLKRRAADYALDVLAFLVTDAEARIDTSLYTEDSLAGYETALSTAKGILKDPVNYTTDEVMDAGAALVEAMDGLQFVVNRFGLKAYIDYAKEILEHQDRYLLVSIENLQAKLSDSISVYEDAAATQAVVDAAANVLLEAISKVYEKGDKTALQALYNLVSRYAEASYTPVSWKSFTDAMTEARKVLDNANALKEQVDGAYGELVGAILGLTRKANLTALDASIQFAQSIVDNIGDYIPSTVSGLAGELAGVARPVSANPNATQAEVDAAAAALNVKILAARLKPDMSGLLLSIQTAATFNTASYTKASVDRLSDAVEAGRALLSAPLEKVAQSAIDTATEGIHAAIANLVKKVETPASALTEQGAVPAAKISVPKAKVARLVVGNRKVVIKWKKAATAAKVTSWQIQYRVRGTSTWRTKAQSARFTTLTIQGLKKNVKYQIRIRACRTVSGSKYYGAWSVTKTSGRVR